MRRLVLACFAMFSSPVLAEDLVVLRSSLASIRVGQIVDGGAVLALPAGGQVTLMTAQGKAVSLNGPYQGIPSPQVAGNGDRNLLSALSGLASRGGVETSALGAYRNPPLGGGANQARLSKAGDINPFDNDTQCAVSGKTNILRIKFMPKGGAATLAVDSGQAVTLDVKDGRALWPQAVPMTDTADYVVVSDSAQAPGRFKLRVLASDDFSEGNLGAQLAAMGCDGQARVLLSGVIRAAKPVGE
ncbi:conserved exported protein of unknown function [Magnetospirillum gryphiswaldense MSR-1 v2]|uniref:Secreted protein n=1 Tax=Magnetospirillum gryphiswaldense (strain DSM 6361 / JCM 21280 / NBRC 15271 / MSR-1) TaxID=431944 RepID=V6F717_MAGGM|nr:hypothetical protein [Magnetospirillum gryphiswaldense]CDL01172.1 conserved exported protein of unknown function [Magnetospirillum gryphiswaldense MSR-1 v2]